MNVQIPETEIIWHPSSTGDPSGRLFQWKGRLLRGLRSESADLVEELFEQGTIDRLIGDGLLVPSFRTSLRTVDYPVVIEHSELPAVSYACEWSPEMLRDAAIVTLRLQIALEDVGCRLHDAHPWNVVFDGVAPRFVDIGSIERGGGFRARWQAQEEFLRYFVNPLMLFRAGEHRLARIMLRDFMVGVENHHADMLSGSVPRLTLGLLSRAANRPIPGATRRRRVARRIVRHLRQLTVQRSVQRLLTQVETIELPTPHGVWSDYYGDEFPDFADHSGWTPKHRSVDQALDDLKPKSLVDVAGNRGWYAMLAARKGARTTAFDLDESSVSILHADALSANLDVLPLVMDITRPTPGDGFLNRHLPPASERLKADTVLALAILHHLCYSQRVPLDLAILSILQFCHESAIIEFIDPSDRYVSEWSQPRPLGYSLGDAHLTLERHFSHVQELPSNLPTRTLLVCKGRKPE